MPAAAPDRQLIAPAYQWVPPHTHTRGPEAADLAASVGIVPDAEQRLVLDSFLATNGHGRFVARTAVVVAARQNLKTAALEMLALDDLFMSEPDLNVWTSHRTDAMTETFLRLVSLVDSWDHLRRRVRKVTRSPGEQEIEALSGARLKFQARSTGAGRALSARVLYYDEGFALTPAHIGASVPILSTRRWAQVRVGSSAGRPESEVLRGYRDVGREGGASSLVYLEWAAPEGSCGRRDCSHDLDTPGCALDRRDFWLLANPAMGRRITEDAIRAERETMPPAEFARERLGWWDRADSVDPIVAAVRMGWSACADPESSATGRVVFAVDVAQFRGTASIVMAGERSDGLAHLQLLEYGDGTDWIVPRLVELRERAPGATVAVDPVGPVVSLVEEIRRADMPVVELKARDMKAACGGLFDAVTTGRLRVVPEQVLDVAVAGAATRTLDDAWAWSRRRSSADISPLVAATVAHWALSSADRSPPFVPLIAYR